MVKISLTNVRVEFRFNAESILVGKARNLSIHFPSFEQVTEFTFQEKLQQFLESRGSLMTGLGQYILRLRQNIICPLIS